jgi:GT2 family glycosyltransferase
VARAASVVIISHNEGMMLRRTVDAVLDTVTPNSEVIVVDDGSADGSADFLVDGYGGVHLVRPPERVGTWRARNIGGALATRPFIVFADAHVSPSPGWLESFAAVLSEPQVAAAGPGVSVMGREGTTAYGFVWRDPTLTWRWLTKLSNQPYEVPMLPGCFYALRRDVFELTGGFDEGLLIWGTGDAELSLRLWLLGYRCIMVPSVEVAHKFKKTHNFALNWELMLHNILRSSVSHLNQARLAQVIAEMRSRPAFPAAFARLLLSDAWERREKLREARKRDDNWYFDYFRLQWPDEAESRRAS